MTEGDTPGRGPHNLAAWIGGVAAEHADNAALSFQGREHTYAELMEEVAALAGRLKKSGVNAGDRVVIFSENSPVYVIALLACARLGAILATAYASYQVGEMTYLVGNSEPQAALVESGRRGVFDDALAATGMRVNVYEIEDSRIAGLPDAAPVYEDTELDAGAGVLISYTSGTTSRPKPVFHSHAGIVEATKVHRRVWRVGPSDRILIALPLAWLFGLSTGTLTGLAAGACVVLMDHFNPLRAMTLLDTEGITLLPGTGTMFRKLLEVAELRGGAPNTGSLRYCVAGGEPRNESAYERFRQLFGCPIHDLYSMSECFPLAAYDPVADPVPRPGSGGRLVSEAIVELRGPNGTVLADGEPGELYARSVGSMLGYFREPEMTAAAVDAAGWFRTKDIVLIDPDRYVYVQGRASDMIIRGGANVSPAEVERVLCSHRSVAEAAVVGMPDEIYGQAVGAFVVLKEGSRANEADLMAHAAAQLARYKVPTAIVVLSEFPRNATGKLLRTALPIQRLAARPTQR